MKAYRPLALACCAALLVLPSHAGAEILWRGDFETGDLTQWDEQVGPVGERVTIVEDPVREGMFAARVEIRPGDLGVGNINRVELGYHPPGEGFEGSERWYAWSAMQDADAPLGASWHSMTYWEADVLFTAALNFRLYPGNQLTFCTYVGGETTHWTTTFEPGMWHDFVLHVVWSADASEGLVELWYDGALVLPATSVATMFTLGDGSATPNFLHVGMLRDDQLDETEVFFYDGVIEASSPDDVMPGASDTTGGESSSGEGGDTDGADSGADTSSAGEGTGASTNASSTSAASEGEASAGTAGTDDGSTGGADDEAGGCGCTQRRAEHWPAVLLVVPLLRRRSRRGMPR